MRHAVALVKAGGGYTPRASAPRTEAAPHAAPPTPAEGDRLVVAPDVRPAGPDWRCVTRTTDWPGSQPGLHVAAGRRASLVWQYRADQPPEWQEDSENAEKYVAVSEREDTDRNRATRYTLASTIQSIHSIADIEQAGAEPTLSVRRMAGAMRHLPCWSGAGPRTRPARPGLSAKLLLFTA